ncbi:Hsp33 family molecular chaperone HslO [Altererythrobacter lutimaris]|uniref:Hsp33 family molecular chaperone HslO n=1 Tax=Altererythrobacter lutimaris TaxID=2743979 RepID=A0A850HBI2_9SPHN|nr:Hsp33 family molecular chaperone HslO [Altererythrobacter lutimaris]NVE95119.1 Hsp33 family molecular chaperone HslO [Altererythrobacter lutimaris]
MTNIQTAPPEIFADQLLGFSLPARNARGRMVRLDKVVDTVLSAHDYPAPIKHLLAEALVLGALMGGLLKNGGQLTMQAQTQEGIVRLLVCDFREGELRGYAEFDAAQLGGLGANPTLRALFGKGHLAVTFETGPAAGGKGNRYQGIVPLEGDSLTEACERYFVQSEQVPTLIRVALQSGSEGCVAAGILVQHLADGEEGRERLHVRHDHPDWEHVAIVGGTLSHAELLDPALSMEGLVWRLYHEEDRINVQPGALLSRGCRCSVEHYTAVLERFPEDERAAMRNDAGEIVVDCAFCSREFILPN